MWVVLQRFCKCVGIEFGIAGMVFDGRNDYLNIGWITLFKEIIALLGISVRNLLGIPNL